MNSFKQLLEEEGKRMTEAESERILNNIRGTMGFLGTVGDAADRYLSRIAEAVLGRATTNERDLRESGPPDLPSNFEPTRVQPGKPDFGDTQSR